MTNSITLKFPITTCKSDMLAFKFDLSQFDTDGFDKIHLYNLSAFLNIFNLFDDDHKIEIKDNFITISNSDTMIKYIESEEVLLSAFELNERQFEITNSMPSVCEFTLTQNDIRKLKTANASFTEMDTVIIKCDEECNIYLSQLNSNNAFKNFFKIRKDVEIKKNFEIGISMEALTKLPNVEWKFAVKYNEAKDSYRIFLTSEDIVGFEVILAVLSEI